MYWVKLSSIGLAVIGLVSCSLTPYPQSIKVQLRAGTRSLRDGGSATPDDPSKFSCYVASVSAADIPNSISGALDGSGRLTPNCLNMKGIVTGSPVTATALSSGIDFTLPSGKARRVTILGVNTSSGTCDTSASVKQLFADGSNLPGVYVLGSSVADITGGTITVDLPNPVADQTNLVSTCNSQFDLAPIAVFKGLASTLPLLSTGNGFSQVTSFPAVTVGVGSFFPSEYFVYEVPDALAQNLASSAPSYNTFTVSSVMDYGAYSLAGSNIVTCDIAHTQFAAQKGTLSLYALGLTRSINTSEEIATGSGGNPSFSFTARAIKDRFLTISGGKKVLALGVRVGPDGSSTDGCAGLSIRMLRATFQ